MACCDHLMRKESDFSPTFVSSETFICSSVDPLTPTVIYCCEEPAEGIFEVEKLSKQLNSISKNLGIDNSLSSGLHQYILSKQIYPQEESVTTTLPEGQSISYFHDFVLKTLKAALPIEWSISTENSDCTLPICETCKERDEVVLTSEGIFEPCHVCSLIEEIPLECCNNSFTPGDLYKNIQFKNCYEPFVPQRKLNNYSSYFKYHQERITERTLLLLFLITLLGFTLQVSETFVWKPSAVVGQNWLKLYETSFAEPLLVTFHSVSLRFEVEYPFSTKKFIWPNTESMASAKASQSEAAGGFPLNVLKGKPDSKFLCSKCRLLLRKPIQSFCGHRYCKSCIDLLLQQKDEKPVVCPMCVVEDAENEYSVLRHDQTFPDNAIKRELKQLQAHCPNVGCSWNGPFLDYEKHEKECLYQKMSCPACGLEITEQDKEAHNLECVAQVSDAILRKQVADIKKTIVNLEAAVLQNQPGATSSPASSLSGAVSQQFEALKMQVTTHEEALRAYQDMFVVMSREVERNTNLITENKTKLSEVVQQREEFEQKINAMERDLAVKNAAMADMNNQLEALEMASYSGVLIWKIEDFARRRTEAINGQRTSLYSPAFYTSRTGYKMCARVYINGDGMGKNNHISLFFVVMKGKYDNLLRWPFRQKVTLTLLDQNLQNPENVVDAFRPDPNSTSFKKPTTAMNIASGCPLFMPLTQLENPARAYVKDDGMFIKISVDLSDI